MKTKTKSTNVFFKNLFEENKNRPSNKSFFQGLLFANEKFYFSGITLPSVEKLRFNYFNYYRIIFFAFFVLASVGLAAQTVVLPSPSSCTSKDLELVGASLPTNPGEDPCACSGTRTLNLTIKNKTGSTRTSFAVWGTLVIFNSDGSPRPGVPIFACAGPIASSSTTTLVSGTSITIACGESLEIRDLFLAWTSASPNETCAKLQANPSLIAPKCGTLPSIPVAAGVNASMNVTDATCAVPGSIVVSPFGGIGPYEVKIGNGNAVQVAIGGSTTFNNLSSGIHAITIKDSNNCEVTISRNIGSAATVTANAGSDFTKTCTTNPNGKQIGEDTAAGFTYSWSPSTGLNAANVSNPTANPSSTTTYTVTKTNTASGCSGTDSVDVTVNTTSVTANAGSDFTKTCTTNANGKQIGEANNAAFTYSWSPSTGLSATNISNPTANPSSTNTYTVTKTNIASGCSGTDSVDVTVSNDVPDAPSVCMVQPALCGPSTGSISINSPTGSQYEYSIDNGNTWQSSPNFNSVAAGSVSGIKVKNVNSGCISSAANCSVSNCTASRTIDTAETLNVEKEMEKEISIKAFPNPFKNSINFVIEVPESGEGSLDLMNMFGQKVKTIFKGTFNEGKNTYEVNLPSNQPSTLIYILNIGDKRLTGKLIQM